MGAWIGAAFLPVHPVAVVAGCLLFLAGVADRKRRVRRGASEWTRQFERGLVNLGRGELDVALARFAPWVSPSDDETPASIVARYFVGWVHMRRRDFGKALEALVENERRGLWRLDQVRFAHQHAADIGLLYALCGELEAAEHWMAEADKRSESISVLRHARIALPRAILDCRSGKRVDALRMLDEHWPDCETILTGSTLRPLKIVRAFALAGDGPRDAGVAAVPLMGVRPLYPGEFDYLGGAWPEMEQFLVSQGLSSTHASRSLPEATGTG